MLEKVEKRAEPTLPQGVIIRSKSKINAFIAGQGAGKTMCAGWVSGNHISQYPSLHGFIGANTFAQLTDSTLFRIRKVWEEYYGWTEYSKYNPQGQYVIDVIPPAHFNTEGHAYDSYYGKICFQNGTVVYKGSLDNYKAHDGKEFAWAILDETKDTKEEAVKEVILGRLREKGLPNNPLFIFTSPAKTDWLNEWFGLDAYAAEIKEKVMSKTDYFRKKIDNKLIVISSSFHNAEHLPEDFLPNQLKNFAGRPQLIDSLIYGNPFTQTGGEFYKCFDREKTIRKLNYDNTLPLHISFDFNVHPYMTCLVYQIKDKISYQIDEICLENPNNTTRAVCQEFRKRYPLKNGLFIYGDPAGHHEDTRIDKRIEAEYNDYTIIMNELRDYNPTKRVKSSAPAVVPRKDFLNAIFENNYNGCEIFIDEKCKKTISDYTYLKEAPDGRKLKEKEKDSQTGISFERYGHTSDAGDYFYTWIYNEDFLKFQKGSGTGFAPLYRKKERIY